MSEIEKFDQQCKEEVKKMVNNPQYEKLAQDFIFGTHESKYTYHFKWLGRPIIQFPQDIIAAQELIWSIQPDVIIETGIAHGGSLIHSASILQLIGGDGIVVGIDIDIRPHNRAEIESHPMAKRIRLVEGSSTDESTLVKVKAAMEGRKKALVFLDSNHTHEHVLAELKMYSSLVPKDSYLVVYDTVIEKAPPSASTSALYPGRSWGVGDNPWTAVKEFLKTNDRFVIDKEIESKLLITVAPDGYLKCVK